MESGTNQLFYSFAEVGKLFGGKSAKTIGRWLQTIAGFPQPVRLGCARLFIREEIENFIQKLKEKRGNRKIDP